ncbi:MAG: ABC transporter substrate-binding protein [Lutispora sp.]|nr:ABC transporter substrate-binding protein [Lutispora sp.]
MKQKRTITVIIIAALVLSLFSGCSGNQQKAAAAGQNEISGESIKEEFGVRIDKDSVTFTDGRDKEVTLNKHPQRVVCLFTSYLEIWDKAGGKVIGKIEDASEKPIESAKDAEIVGTQAAPSLEKIIALQPDLVIINGNSKISMDLVPALEQNNIGILAMKFFVKEDYFKIARIFTALTDREDLYNEYGLKVKNDVETIINKAPKDKGYKAILMMASAKSITVRDSSSYVGQMLKDLNVENICDGSELTTDAKVFSMETILEKDPDFIFVQVTGTDQSKVFEKLKKDVESNPAWASLKAVKEGRYIFLPKELYMYKANHRYAEAYEGLAKIIYPEVFN